MSGIDACLVVLFPADMPAALPGESGVENTILKLYRPIDTLTGRWSVASQVSRLRS